MTCSLLVSFLVQTYVIMSYFLKRKAQTVPVWLLLPVFSLPVLIHLWTLHSYKLKHYANVDAERQRAGSRGLPIPLLTPRVTKHLYFCGSGRTVQVNQVRLRQQTPNEHTESCHWRHIRQTVSCVASMWDRMFTWNSVLAWLIASEQRLDLFFRETLNHYSEYCCWNSAPLKQQLSAAFIEGVFFFLHTATSLFFKTQPLLSWIPPSLVFLLGAFLTGFSTKKWLHWDTGSTKSF